MGRLRPWYVETGNPVIRREYVIVKFSQRPDPHDVYLDCSFKIDYTGLYAKSTKYFETNTLPKHQPWGW